SVMRAISDSMCASAVALSELADATRCARASSVSEDAPTRNVRRETKLAAGVIHASCHAPTEQQSRVAKRREGSHASPAWLHPTLESSQLHTRSRHWQRAHRLAVDLGERVRQRRRDHRRTWLTHTARLVLRGHDVSFDGR